MLEVVEYNVISHPGSYKFHCCKGGRKNNEKSGYCSIVGDIAPPPPPRSSAGFYFQDHQTIRQKDEFEDHSA